MIRYTGARVKRLEDPRLLGGRGRFLDDVVLPRMLSVAFVRSPHARAAIRSIDVGLARALAGVSAVVTAAELAGVAGALAPRFEGDGFRPTAQPPLADGEVRFVGQAVAAVAAGDVYVAADACEQVAVEYESRPAIASLEQALTAGDVLFRRAGRHGDVDGAFARAPIALREIFTHARCAPSPLESRGIVADWDGGTLTAWASTQSPTVLRIALARALGLPADRVRIVVPDVGGGFGLKTHVFPEDVVVAALARMLERPVKWVETRRESLAAASQARGQRMEAEVAAAGDGTLLALRARVLSDAGAYHIHPLTAALEPLGSAAILPGPYRTPAYAWEAVALRTDKPPLGAYRGVGMTMGAFVMERLLDLVAARAGLDPVEVRRRNLIPRDAYPFTSASGMIYDSGDYPKMLEHALVLARYDDLRREQAAARASGRRLGVGVACYTEYTGMGSRVFRGRGMLDVPGGEAATVAMNADGSVRCLVSFPSQGQGHATTIAQVVADRLGVELERVTVVPLDTRDAPAGSGTFASRGAVAIGGTVGAAAGEIRARLLAAAARGLEASVEDVVLEDGRAHVRGFPDRALTVTELARQAGSRDGGSLTVTVDFDPPGPTFSGAVHVAAVEVDPETGRVSVRRYIVVEDCGPVVNPTIVEGQIHGAVAQGIGEALLEAVVHDETGQPLSGTLMDYALPRAADVPVFEIGHEETPAPGMPGGVKGMGEGGTIGAPAAIANAVADALGPDGVRITALPIRPAVVLGSNRR